MPKKPPFVIVATPPVVMARCMARYLNTHGVPTAVKRTTRGRRLNILVKYKDYIRAERLLARSRCCK